MLRYLALETKRQYHLYILGCLTDGSGLAAPKASLGSRSWIAVVQLVNGMFADSDRCKAVEEAFTSCVLFTEDVAILEEVTVVVLPMRVRFQVKVQERLWASRQFSAEAQTSSTKEASTKTRTHEQSLLPRNNLYSCTQTSSNTTKL